jgi:hypothetical protein
MRHCSTSFGVGPALGDFVKHIEVVQNFIEAAIVREAIQQGPYSLLGFHVFLLQPILHDQRVLFHLFGFSFAERPGDERDLGRELLEHVAAKSPRTKIGKSAKNKLKLLKG